MIDDRSQLNGMDTNAQQTVGAGDLSHFLQNSNESSEPDLIAQMWECSHIPELNVGNYVFLNNDRFQIGQIALIKENKVVLKVAAQNEQIIVGHLNDFKSAQELINFECIPLPESLFSVLPELILKGNLPERWMSIDSRVLDDWRSTDYRDLNLRGCVFFHQEIFFPVLLNVYLCLCYVGFYVICFLVVGYFLYQLWDSIPSLGDGPFCDNDPLTQICAIFCLTLSLKGALNDFFQDVHISLLATHYIKHDGEHPVHLCRIQRDWFVFLFIIIHEIVQIGIIISILVIGTYYIFNQDGPGSIIGAAVALAFLNDLDNQFTENYISLSWKKKQEDIPGGYVIDECQELQWRSFMAGMQGGLMFLNIIYSACIVTSERRNYCSA